MDRNIGKDSGNIDIQGIVVAVPCILHNNATNIFLSLDLSPKPSTALSEASTADVLTCSIQLVSSILKKSADHKGDASIYAPLLFYWAAWILIAILTA